MTIPPEQWLERWRRAMETVDDVGVLQILRRDLEERTRRRLTRRQVEEALDQYNKALKRLSKQHGKRAANG